MVEGKLERFDYEYTRNGTANLFMISESLPGWRTVKVNDRRTMVDFAEVIRWLVAIHNDGCPDQAPSVLPDNSIVADY